MICKNQKEDNKSCRLAKQHRFSWQGLNRRSRLLHRWLHQSSVLTAHFAPLHISIRLLVVAVGVRG